MPNIDYFRSLDTIKDYKKNLIKFIIPVFPISYKFFEDYKETSMFAFSNWTSGFCVST